MSDTIDRSSGAWYDAEYTEGQPTAPVSSADGVRTTDATAPVPAAPLGGRREDVVCPECGAHQPVTLNRRDSMDFCAECDYPLFWTPQQIQLGDGANAEEALRRLPGTMGRVTVASLPCPHCNEANSITALTCIRCHQPMVVSEPAPVVQAPPPPAPEPAKGTPIWLWVVVALTALLVVGLAWAAFGG